MKRERRIVGVYIAEASEEDTPSFESPYYALAYADLFERIIKLGAQPVVVHDAERTYVGGGLFRRSIG